MCQIGFHRIVEGQLSMGGPRARQEVVKSPGIEFGRELPNISGGEYASEDKESIDMAVVLLLDRMRIGSPNLTSTRAGPR